MPNLSAVHFCSLACLAMPQMRGGAFGKWKSRDKIGAILRLFVTGTSRRLPPDILKRAVMRLLQLDAATQLQDLRLPASNRLEALRGDRRQVQHSHQ
jgi:plasmid maintenance system killer protein